MSEKNQTIYKISLINLLSKKLTILQTYKKKTFKTF
jgi:hypothetical protein